MPRIAASMMVVAVVVCSIGLNIHRYPVVWQMAAAPRPVSQADESSSTETTSRAETGPESADFSQSEAPVESVDAGYSYDDSYQDDPSYASSSYAYSTPNEDESDEYSRQDNTYQHDSSTDSYSYSGSYAEKSGGAGEYGAEYGAEYGSGGSEAYSHGNSAGSSYQDACGTGRNAYGASQEPIANHESQPYEYQPVDQSTSTEYGANWPAEAAPAAKYGSAAAQGGDWDLEKPLVPVMRDDPLEETNTPVAAAGPTRGLGVEAGSAGRVRRLPPTELEQPIPADNYANRLPESPIPVYPSTGY